MATSTSTTPNTSNMRFQTLNSDTLVRKIGDFLLPRLTDLLAGREAGHCMRIADLDEALLLFLCRSLHQRLPGVQTCILGSANGQEADLYVSSTKLVELRNRMEEGIPGPPLLVFLPPNLRASAEDSFGVATFEVIDVLPWYDEFARSLVLELDAEYQGVVASYLQDLERRAWPWANRLATIRYLLTAQINGIDGEVLGAALYELGLIPDRELWAAPDLVIKRIQDNRECMSKLLSSEASLLGRIHELGLSDLDLRKRLGQFLRGVEIERPNVWAQTLLMDRAGRELCFDKWRFQDSMLPDRVRIRVTDLDLPKATGQEADQRLHSLIENYYLAPKQKKTLTVTFAVEPAPSRVKGLDHFIVQLVSLVPGEESQPIGVERRKPIWQNERRTTKLTLTSLNQVDFEEGWYAIRVVPCTAAGDPVPLEPDQESRTPNESEAFYILPDMVEQTDGAETGRTTPQEPSLQHALIRACFQAIQNGRDPMEIATVSAAWTKNNARGKAEAQEVVSFRFSSQGQLWQTFVPPILKQLEQTILQSPRDLRLWRIDIEGGAARLPDVPVLEWPKSVAFEAFLDARTAYFATVQQGEANLVTQGISLSTNRALAYSYAEAYRDWLADILAQIGRATGAELPNLAKLLRLAISIDAARLVIEDHRGRRRSEAFLLGPTHPLRALYFAGWTALAQNWIQAVTEQEDYRNTIRDTLLEEFNALDVPSALVLPDGRLVAATESLHPYWQLYTSLGETNPRGLVADVCGAIGLEEPSLGGNAITGELIALRIARFLTQQPYIRTLSLNAFNPGSATVLADALIALQKQESFAHLRYDIRLFVADPEAPGVGSALEQLLSPERGGSREEVDAFARSTGNHLFPKLSLAVQPIRGFSDRPEAHRAHITLLFEMFQAQEVVVQPPLPDSEIASPLHGLMQSFVRSYEEDEAGSRWLRQPQHGPAEPLPGAPEISGMLTDLALSLSRATATAATLLAGTDLPTLRLQLGLEQKTFLHQVHQVSDWVFLIDRYIGIEYFDHGARSDRPNYLVDYTPGGKASDDGHKLIITSRSLLEIETIFGRMLESLHLPESATITARLMGDLRSLSGRLALKLVSATSQQYEALGLALARRFLEAEGALTNQIVLPLDAHLDLFRSNRTQFGSDNDPLPLHRTDLALFDLNEADRIITCKLVEVKCHQSVSTSAMDDLMRHISQQVKRSETVLKQHFDPQIQRPDRPILTQSFARMLSFYLDRASRYNLLLPDAIQEGHYLLATLERGYTLEFQRVAFVFDLDRQVSEDSFAQDEIEYHWIGGQEIRRLLETETSPTEERRTAAFIAQARNRSRRSTDSQEDISDRSADRTPTASSDQATRSVSFNLLASLETQNVPVVPAEDETLSNLLQDQIPIVEPENVSFQAMLGVNHTNSPQYGILGEANGRRVALDLNGTQTISLFGVQGSGKSYSLGTILEMACLNVNGLNRLPKPLASILFHYSPTMDYAPEFTSMIDPNTDEKQLEILRTQYGVEAQSLDDIVLLVPRSQMEARLREYPRLQIAPIAFASSELKSGHWKFLMGAVGSQSLYIRQITQILRRMRDNLNLTDLVAAVDASDLTDHLKGLARTRLQFATEYINDTQRLTDLVRPGRLIIVDLRDEFIEKDEALGLFIVLLQLFSEATQAGVPFNKMVVFDEAHKYIENPDLLTGLIEVIREMRHKGTSVLVASQDPMSVPTSLIELSTQIILHKMNSPAWLRHIQRANAALGSLNAERMSQLGAGEAYVWSSAATDPGFVRGAVRVRLRPRVTRHGGSTRTAV